MIDNLFRVVKTSASNTFAYNCSLTKLAVLINVTENFVVIEYLFLADVVQHVGC